MFVNLVAALFHQEELVLIKTDCLVQSLGCDRFSESGNLDRVVGVSVACYDFHNPPSLRCWPNVVRGRHDWALESNVSVLGGGITMSDLVSQHRSQGTRMREKSSPFATRSAVGGCVLVVDFGSQYTRLITRSVRELGVFTEVIPHSVSPSQLGTLNVKGIILSGGPDSVHDAESASLPKWIWEAGVPVLGICYGLQLLVHAQGGIVRKSSRREYGPTNVSLKTEDPLFDGIQPEFMAWMSHSDSVMSVPPNCDTLAYGKGNAVAAVKGVNWWGVQFHPEVTHTAVGRAMIANYVLKICGCQPTGEISGFVEETVRDIQQEVGDRRVLCALSGGVDSAVTAKLVELAIGDRLRCVFVDNGLLRTNEVEEVRESVQTWFDAPVGFVSAPMEFLDALAGISEPEQKRKIIGRKFVEVFDRFVEANGPFDYLAQGTLYPDVIESGAGSGKAATIKTHHNVGGLPSIMRLKLIEPLRLLFKDEVRKIGQELGMPDNLLKRQPFPGPGQAIRIVGEIKVHRLAQVRLADAIIRKEIEEAGLADEIWQYFAILLPTQSVGVIGDERAYGDVIVVRAVTSDDAMTADWARIPWDVLARISTRIMNEVPNVTRVCYDVTTKPPGTIEWE